MYVQLSTAMQYIGPKYSPPLSQNDELLKLYSVDDNDISIFQARVYQASHDLGEKSIHILCCKFQFISNPENFTSAGFPNLKCAMKIKNHLSHASLFDGKCCRPH